MQAISRVPRLLYLSEGFGEGGRAGVGLGFKMV